MPPFIVAEAAQGYEGNPALACLLVRAAAGACADAIKFQLVFADEIAAPDYKYYKLFKTLEMSREAWRTVAATAKNCGIELYFDVFGRRSFELARSLKAHGLKIHTSDFYHEALLKKLLRTRLKILISCAGLSKEDLLSFFERHPNARRKNVTFLHGFQGEPTKLSSNNLRRLDSLAEICRPAGIGFMDHSEGSAEEAMELALLALPFGISVLEKHVSLDRELKLEDYISALPPTRFQKFTKKIHLYTKALGNYLIKPNKKEILYRKKSSKVIVAAKNLRKGEILRPKCIILLRKNNQEALHFLSDPKKVQGKKLKRPLKKYEGLQSKDLETT